MKGSLSNVVECPQGRFDGTSGLLGAPSADIRDLNIGIRLMNIIHLIFA